MAEPDVQPGEKGQPNEDGPDDTESDPQSNMDPRRPYRSRNENNPHKDQPKYNRHAPRVPYGFVINRDDEKRRFRSTIKIMRTVGFDK